MKKFYRNNRLDVRLHFPVLLLIAFSYIGSSFAQPCSVVTGMMSNGQQQQSLPLKIFGPGSKDGGQQLVKIGYKLFSGYKIEVRPGMTVQLKSPGGTQNVTAGKSPMLYNVELKSNSEEHIALGTGGKIENTVVKKLGYSYRNSNEKGVSATTHSTVFSFTDLGAGNARLNTSEGKISIVEQVAVKIIDESGKKASFGSKGDVIKKSASRMQSSGDEESTFGSGSVEYANYESAINAIASEVNKKTQVNADPEELADDFSALGELYMETEQFESAVTAFRKAVRYYQVEDDPEDMSTLESKLHLSEALLNSKLPGSEDEGKSLVAACKEALLEALHENEEDFHLSTDDPELQELICADIREKCDLLGWSCDILDDESGSSSYYARSDKETCE